MSGRTTMGQREIVRHGGLFDGRVVPVGPQEVPRDRVDFLVMQEPEVVQPEWGSADSLYFLVATYVLARTSGYRSRLVYVPTAFYMKRREEQQP